MTRMYVWLVECKSCKQAVGKCQCGCNIDIRIMSSHRKILSRFAHGHNGIGINNGHYKGGRYIDKHGYIMILNPKHPYHSHNGYVKEHRLVMERYLGRYLTPDEIVHHINRVKTDNRIENLQLTTKALHINMHRDTLKK